MKLGFSAIEYEGDGLRVDGRLLYACTSVETRDEVEADKGEVSIASASRDSAVSSGRLSKLCILTVLILLHEGCGPFEILRAGGTECERNDVVGTAGKLVLLKRINS